MLQFPDLNQADLAWHDFDWRDLLVEEWRPGKLYASGALVRPRAANGFFYECSTAGQSAARPPNFPRTASATVVDGSVTWTARTPAVASEPTIASCTYAFSPTGQLVEDDTAVDNAQMISRVRIDPTGAKPGDYIVTATMTDSSGEIFVQEARVRVVLS